MSEGAVARRVSPPHDLVRRSNRLAVELPPLALRNGFPGAADAATGGSDSARRGCTELLGAVASGPVVNGLGRGFVGESSPPRPNEAFLWRRGVVRQGRVGR